MRSRGGSAARAAAAAAVVPPRHPACVVAVDVPPTAAHYDEMVVNISMMQEGCSFVLQVGGGQLMTR